VIGFREELKKNLLKGILANVEKLKFKKKFYDFHFNFLFPDNLCFQKNRVTMETTVNTRGILTRFCRVPLIKMIRLKMYRLKMRSESLKINDPICPPSPVSFKVTFIFTTVF